MLEDIVVTRTRVQVYIGYDIAFLAEAHKLDGRYRRKSRMWSFKRSQYPQVAEVLNRLYNYNLSTQEFISREPNSGPVPQLPVAGTESRT